MNERFGTVYLVGAGPGDPDLITVKGLRFVQSADVVVHDRLVSNELLEKASSDAELIDVGKYPDHHRFSQDEINRILVDRATSGAMVVRLKGGDPFVFGRGSEESEFCRAHGVLCQVVPGISSSIAGPASVGIPVTKRGISRSFAVLTGQTDPSLPEHQIDFQALSKIDTVVFMMGRKNLDQLANSMKLAGRSGNTPVTCIQQATMPTQKSVSGTLDNIADRANSQNLANPMITIIGDVAELSPDQQLDRAA